MRFFKKGSFTSCQSFLKYFDKIKGKELVLNVIVAVKIIYMVLKPKEDRYYQWKKHEQSVLYGAWLQLRSKVSCVFKNEGSISSIPEKKTNERI